MKCTVNIGVTTSTISQELHILIQQVKQLLRQVEHILSQVGMGVSLADIGFSCAYGAKNYPEKQPFVFRVGVHSFNN